MTYYTIPPSPQLADYVRFFWVLESEVFQDKPYIHRSMADGCAEIIFHYEGRFDELLSDGKSEKSFISGMHGQSRKFSRFIIDRSFGIFGVYLYPFAIPRLFNMPASEISNHMPDLSTLLGQEGRDLEDKIMLAADNQKRMQIMTAFLKSKLIKNNKGQPPIFSAISFIIDQKGLINVEQLADQYFLSTRQFERKFKAFAGFSPKLYSRIIRFQSTMKAYGNGQKSLTEIAYDGGYYDQSHFIHDFKEFSGHHPRHYFKGEAEGTEWKR